jgi:hypothetical protein
MNRIRASSSDPIIEGALLTQMLESGAPVLIQPHFTPAQRARSLVNQGFRFVKKVRKGRYQDIDNGHGMGMSIKGGLLEEFLKILPRFE